jgi:hypothetical protein
MSDLEKFVVIPIVVGVLLALLKYALDDPHDRK